LSVLKRVWGRKDVTVDLTNRCAVCGQEGRLDFVDLVRHGNRYSCTSCGHRWTVGGAEADVDMEMWL
jgi:DNA-directed RNA polymerase subunit RPC12/RpoP